MRFDERIRAGNDSRLVSRLLISFLLAIFVMVASNAVLAESLYKYRGKNGEWIYSDRAPKQDSSVEIRDLPKGDATPGVIISHRSVNGLFRIEAQNDYYAPVEVLLALDAIDNLALPAPDQPFSWVVPARSRKLLLELALLDPDWPATAEYRDMTLLGDPDSSHTPVTPYRAPFAIASVFTVTQAFPVGVTHRTPDSFHAVDLSMPVGTNIHAARAGLVFDVASTNFAGGRNPERYLASANVVRILHNDGSYSVYAHLNWNSIRVQPGDEVERGQYIADSGNTGFSSGPHLHFAVIRNKGLRVESVPIVFEGPKRREIVPVTGVELVAY